MQHTCSPGGGAGLAHCSSPAAAESKALFSSFNLEALSSHICFSLAGKDFHSLPTILLISPKVDSGLFWTTCFRTSREYKM